MAGRAAAIGIAAAAGTAYVAWQLRHRAEQVELLTGRIPGLHEYWKRAGRARDGAVLLVAIGDSATLGVGSSRPEHSWVGLIATRIARRTDRAVRVRNLAIDGARVRTCIEEELPRLPADPDLVVVGVGGNDVWTFDPQRFRADLDALLAALPPGTIVGEVPSFAPLPVERRVRAMNRVLREVAASRGMPVAPVHATTARGGVVHAVRNAAGDLFHPNDRGHARWAEAYASLVDAALAASRTPEIRRIPGDRAPDSAETSP